MGKKDIMDRPFFSDRERFAELVNAVLYGGRQILLPVNLVLHRRKYPSLSSAGGESERDVLMEDAVDTKDATYIAWTTDETISLQEYLRYAISMNWIDVTKISGDNPYLDSQEIYQSVLSYMEEYLLEDDT